MVMAATRPVPLAIMPASRATRRSTHPRLITLAADTPAGRDARGREWSDHGPRSSRGAHLAGGGEQPLDQREAHARLHGPRDSVRRVGDHGGSGPGSRPDHGTRVDRLDRAVAGPGRRAMVCGEASRLWIGSYRVAAESRTDSFVGASHGRLRSVSRWAHRVESRFGLLTRRSGPRDRRGLPGRSRPRRGMDMQTLSVSVVRARQAGATAARLLASWAPG